MFLIVIQFLTTRTQTRKKCTSLPRICRCVVGTCIVVVILGALYCWRCRYCSQKLDDLRQQSANPRAAAAAAKLQLQEAEAAAAALEAQQTDEAVVVDPAAEGSAWRFFGFAPLPEAQV
jgi:hypothetical protein